MSASDKKTIAVLGFAANEQAMLDVFFAGSHSLGFVLKPLGEAKALLVDLKDDAAEADLLKWQKDGDRPWIGVVSEGQSPPAIPRGVCIERPLSIKLLQDGLSSLDRLRAQSQEEVADSLARARSGGALEKEREAVFAEWQARKQRSSEAASVWQGEHQLRQDEGFRSQFSLQRNELNGLILEAQKELKKQSGEPKPAPKAKKVEPEVEAIQAPSMSAEMILQCCGSLSDVNLDAATERRRVYFSLDGLLLPWILRAVKQAHETGKVQQVVGVPGALFYLPLDHSFLVGIDSDLLLQLTRTRFGFDEISLVERGPEQELPKGRKVAADEMLWQLALFTARGRIPDTLSAEEPHLLKEMPDFDRLLETPHARSIAQLWQSQKLSARNVATMLSVPQRFVFSFLVAADAVGLYCQ